MLASQLPPESPLKVALSEGDSLWTLEAQLLAGVFDTLQAANWQRAGSKGRRPQPLPRPGVTGRDSERIGGSTTYTVDEMRELLDRHSRGKG